MAEPSGTADDDRLLTPGEVRAMWRISSVTLCRWKAAGLVHPVRTPGGSFRYRASEMAALMRQQDGGAP
jgi:predicted site-specific integrase-resolvase